MFLLRKHHTVAEISRICLTLSRTLLTLPLKSGWDSMMWNGTRRVLKAVAAGSFLAVAVAGCGTAPTKAEAPPEGIVKQRSQERWDAMVAGDLEKVYAYMSPAGRQTISLEAFRNSVRPGFWKKAEVTGVTCEKDACDVTLQLTYVYRGSTIQTPARETWVRSDGAWWHVFKPA